MKTKGNIKKMASGRRDLFLLDPELIREDPEWNVRQDCDDLQSHIRTLANSIKELGVQQPLTVFMKGESVTVTDGHCRLLAVKLAISEGAEIKSIPVRTEERFSNEADRVLSMLTRNSGRPLSIPEQADVIKRLLAFGWTESEIAKKTGSSQQHINTIIHFISSPVEVQQMVKSGDVSATMAVQQVRRNGDEAVGVLKGAVAVARKAGKKRATAKHLPRTRDIIRPIENYAGNLPENMIEESSEILEICKRLRVLIG